MAAEAHQAVRKTHRDAGPTDGQPASLSSSRATGREMHASTIRGRNVENPAELEEMGYVGGNGAAALASTSEKEFVHQRPLSPSLMKREHSLSSPKLTMSPHIGGNGSGGLSTGKLTGKDRESFMLLILLYLLQGIPIGLTFGTLPFLLKPKLTYSQLGLFSLSTYPYSLKLLWSPIVDAWFNPKFGRRKSWIVPVQVLIGCAMWWLGGQVNGWIAEEQPDIKFLTTIFVTLIFFAATQDIAVDGWALTLLSKENLSYASTAQTIGLNTGYFLSFTVFLAFNSVEFGNKYFRTEPLDVPLITLGGYLRFWSFWYAFVTVWLTVWKKEDPVSADDPDMDVSKVYKVMYSILKLKHIQSFVVMHLIAKVGFMANDSITSLKLLEKGFLKEDMAVAVLIDFPFQMLGGWIAASWSKGERPLKPWIFAFASRLVFALFSICLVAGFPETIPVSNSFFWVVIGSTVIGSFTSTVQFVGISAFHTKIADPLIGGTYMTLLNTVSNMGGTWPKPFVLRGVDYFTTATCRIVDGSQDVILKTSECVSEHGKNACTTLGGTCVTETDGYYAVSAICVAIGTVVLFLYAIPTARKLQALPASAWKVHVPV